MLPCDASVQHLWKSFVNLRELIRPADVGAAWGNVSGTPMDAEKSEFYWRKAAEFRSVAEGMTLANARLQLLWMARKFEQLVERTRVEERERQAAD
jgi:hypothetical protein